MEREEKQKGKPTQTEKTVEYRTRPARLKTVSDFEVYVRARARKRVVCVRAPSRTTPRRGRSVGRRRERGCGTSRGGISHLSVVHARAFTYA